MRSGSLGKDQIDQSAIFAQGEGNRWFQRNKDAPRNHIVNAILTSIDCKPKTIVEVGCGYGRYLNEMQRTYQCECIGFDPSTEAIDYGRRKFPKLDLRFGTDGSFAGIKMDILVFGFCLYLTDRKKLFRVVDDADWCLNENGYLVIHDFDQEKPEKVPYHHADGVYSYKMDYSKLWLANPAYQLLSKRETVKGESITVIQKKGWNRWLSQTSQP